MGSTFNTIASVTASLVSKRNKKKTIKKIKKINDANRNISSVGCVTVDDIFPLNCITGNVCISGGEEDIRKKLIVQNVLQSYSVGLPVIIIHEGDYHLEHALSSVCKNCNYFRIINSSNPYYEPIYRLNDDDAARLVVDSSSGIYKIDADGVLYLRGLCSLLRKKGINPYVRMLGSCPHNLIQNIIMKEEQAGIITSNEATSLRNDINMGINSRASIECLLSSLQAEADIVSWKNHLSRSTSILECVKTGGVISIDVSTTYKQSQLSLIITELEKCITLGFSCKLIVVAKSISSSNKMIECLKKTSRNFSWTLSTPDIGNFSADCKVEVPIWLALSQKTILFSHSVKTAELLSAELGDYEHIEISESHAGNNNIGQFGFHFGSTNNLSTTNKRERVIKPEDILNLNDGEFIILDNNNANLIKGVVV